MNVTAKAVLAAALAAALLAGCSANSTLQPPAPNGAPAIERLTVAAPGIAVIHRALPAARRLSPNPCCVQTLFVSDIGTNQVQLYKFPNGNHVGTLPPPPETFNGPEGECVDVNNPQNVFVTNTNMLTIDEYTHSGTYVMHLMDPGEYPVSCAYRQTGPNSGLLAVGNILATSGAGGSVSVYIDNNGTWSGPTVHTPQGNVEVFFLSYIGSKLFLDVLNAGVFQFMVMSQNGNFGAIPLTGSLCMPAYPGGVQMIGNYLAVGDQTPSAGCPNIYHVQPGGQVVGSTTLSPAPADLVQFFRKGASIVGPDAGAANADIYGWPGGGFLTPVTAALVQPIGSAVSHQ